MHYVAEMENKRDFDAVGSGSAMTRKSFETAGYLVRGPIWMPPYPLGALIWRVVEPTLP